MPSSASRNDAGRARRSHPMLLWHPALGTLEFCDGQDNGEDTTDGSASARGQRDGPDGAHAPDSNG